MKAGVLSITFIAALACLVGCEKQAGSPIIPADEIMIGSTVVTGSSVQTRLPYEGTPEYGYGINSSFRPRVLASDNTDMTAPFHAIGTMTFYDMTTAVGYDKPITEGSFAFPGESGDDLLYLVGFYPGVTYHNTSYYGGKLRMPINGNDDVMYAPRVSTTANNVGAGDYSTLAFVHALTKFTFAFSGDEDAIAMKTTVTGVQLVRMINYATLPNRIVFDMSNTTDGAPVIEHDPDQYLNYGDILAWDIPSRSTLMDSVAFAGGEGITENVPYPVTASKTQKAYMIAPCLDIVYPSLTYPQYVFEIAYTVEINGVPEPRTSLVGINLMDRDGSSYFYGQSTAGKAWTLNFNFEGNQITAIVSVAEWDNISSVDMDI